MSENTVNHEEVVEQEAPIDLPAERYVILIGDGMGDYPIDSLGGKTALEAARTPTMDRLCRLGELGLLRTIPQGFPVGSDVANMSILGYDPAQSYTGRGPLEAAARGVEMNPEDVAFRCNLVTLGFQEGRVFMRDYSAGHITTEEAHALLKDLIPMMPERSFSFVPGVSYRHLLIWKGGPEGIATVPPHDFTDQDVTDAWHIYEEEPLLYEVLTKAITLFDRHPVNVKRKSEGKMPANSLWPWGQGRKPIMATLAQLYGLTGGVVAAVELIRRLGSLAGLEIVEVEGATGYLDTNYLGKAKAALELLREKQFVVVHVEAPDEAGHMGDARAKVKAIERFDKEVVGPVLDGLREMGGAYRVMVVTDHYTPVAVRTHVREPVPFVIFDNMNPRENPGAVFSEKGAAATGISFEQGHQLMAHFIGATPREVDLTPRKKSGVFYGGKKAAK